MAEAKQARHEPGDIDARKVLWGAVAIVLGILLAALASYLLWQRWDAPSAAQPLGGPNAGALPAIAHPALQSAPQQERAQYFAEKQRLLDSWEWIDRRHGIARIPVEQAMQIMAAQRGTAPATSRGQR